MTTRPKKKPDVIYAALLAEILDGRWPVGENLPKELDLAYRFQCSPGTVNKAIALLVHEGLVIRKNRMGTRVINNSLNSQPDQIRMDAFAFIYPSERHEGIWRTVSGFQQAATENGRRVVMLSTGADYQRESEFVGRLSEFDVQGAVVYPIISSPQEQVHFSQMLVNTKFPVVLAALSFPGLSCPSVVSDGFHAGYTMTRHMIERGAKRIGFFSNYAWAPARRDRCHGYRWALEEAGLTEPENGVYLVNAMNPDFQDPFRQPTQMAETYFKKAGKLDAVVCADDCLALSCIAAARSLGIKSPDDLLVSGMDDYSNLAASMGVELTTYHSPFELIGRRSFEVLSSIIKGNGPDSGETLVRGDIVIRNSA